MSEISEQARWFRNEYRVVRDFYCGFEVQIRRWWLPMWLQVGINTHSSLERAEEFACRHANPRSAPQPKAPLSRVVKYLGALTKEAS